MRKKAEKQTNHMINGRMMVIATLSISIGVWKKSSDLVVNFEQGKLTPPPPPSAHIHTVFRMQIAIWADKRQAISDWAECTDRWMANQKRMRKNATDCRYCYAAMFDKRDMHFLPADHCWGSTPICLHCICEWFDGARCAEQKSNARAWWKPPIWPRRQCDMWPTEPAEKGPMCQSKKLNTRQQKQTNGENSNWWNE